ncbi:hypothetical protein AMATHDRAFT_51565 [Amanita thiersii Skay4041]|uniref:Uncharacterized protein n=1 Tax=Amanita thiersii Skay4041 TaxID=703135 RepID=A0A2A9N8W1_9AGAR|nr:hypothetical protein AMATHDRAFT_51565 [Amanita thiersii Skay4041]
MERVEQEAERESVFSIFSARYQHLSLRSFIIAANSAGHFSSAFSMRLSSVIVAATVVLTAIFSSGQQYERGCDLSAVGRQSLSSSHAAGAKTLAKKELKGLLARDPTADEKSGIDSLTMRYRDLTKRYRDWDDGDPGPSRRRNGHGNESEDDRQRRRRRPSHRHDSEHDSWLENSQRHRRTGERQDHHHRQPGEESRRRRQSHRQSPVEESHHRRRPDGHRIDQQHETAGSSSQAREGPIHYGRPENHGQQQFALGTNWQFHSLTRQNPGNTGIHTPPVRDTPSPPWEMPPMTPIAFTYTPPDSPSPPH